MLSCLIFQCHNFVATHCLIEFDEPKKPINVVERKRVKLFGGNRGPVVGDDCLVDVLKRSKVVQYPATLLASGPKKDIDLEMARLINQNASSDESEQEPEPPKKKRRTVSKTYVTNAAL